MSKSLTHIWNRTHSFLTALLLVIATFCPPPLQACECAGVAELEDELERSEVIFAGKALTVDESLISGSATFEVSRIWRGEIGAVVTTSNTWDCWSVFRVGEEYLVFSRKVDGELGLDYQLVASRCGKTRQLSCSGKALAVLGPGSPPRSNTYPPSIKLGVLLISVVVLSILLTAVVVATVRKRRLRSVV